MSDRFDPGSFRDPDGRVFHHKGDIFRTVEPARLEDIKALAACDGFQSLVNRGLVLPFAILPTDQTDDLDPSLFGHKVLRQRKIPFISYPAEWSFEMLREAALTTLRVTRDALQAGFILKDATPFNIVFEGKHPRFVDILSFVPYRPGKPWLAYGQFCRTFLYPLLIASYKKIDTRPWLLAQSQELTPTEAKAFFNMVDLRRPGVFKDVCLASWFGSPTADHQVQEMTTRVEFSKTLIISNLDRLEKIVATLPSPHGKTGTWTNYAQDNSYDAAATQEKVSFVGSVLASAKPVRVLDIGCNSGTYTRLAAQHASGPVIGLDYDLSVIDRLYRSIQDSQQIYPVVGNLAHPTPATGWALKERPSMLQRIKGDFFLALAVIHHLRVTANVPFKQIIAQLAELAPQGIIEWVEPTDEMAQKIMAPRDCVYPDYELGTFKALLAEHFEIAQSLEVKQGKRQLFVLKGRRTPRA